MVAVHPDHLRPSGFTFLHVIQEHLVVGRQFPQTVVIECVTLKDESLERDLLKELEQPAYPTIPQTQVHVAEDDGVVLLAVFWLDTANVRLVLHGRIPPEDATMMLNLPAEILAQTTKSRSRLAR